MSGRVFLPREFFQELFLSDEMEIERDYLWENTEPEVRRLCVQEASKEAVIAKVNKIYPTRPLSAHALLMNPLMLHSDHIFPGKWPSRDVEEVEVRLTRRAEAKKEERIFPVLSPVRERLLRRQLRDRGVEPSWGRRHQVRVLRDVEGHLGCGLYQREAGSRRRRKRGKRKRKDSKDGDNAGEESLVSEGEYDDSQEKREKRRKISEDSLDGLNAEEEEGQSPRGE